MMQLAMEPSYGVSDLVKLVDVSWNNIDLLEEAIREASFVHENPDVAPADNTKLAFLGDAALELVVRRELLQRSAGASLGELATAASRIVENKSLAVYARKIGLGPMLALGNRRTNEDSISVLATAFEAILGAVYLDQGWPAAEKLAKAWLGDSAFQNAPIAVG